MPDLVFSVSLHPVTPILLLPSTTVTSRGIGQRGGLAKRKESKNTVISSCAVMPLQQDDFFLATRLHYMEISPVDKSSRIGLVQRTNF